MYIGNKGHSILIKSAYFEFEGRLLIFQICIIWNLQNSFNLNFLMKCNSVDRTGIFTLLFYLTMVKYILDIFRFDMSFLSNGNFQMLASTVYAILRNMYNRFSPSNLTVHNKLRYCTCHDRLQLPNLPIHDQT